MDLKGKTALVTGGASGLGRATAELFAARGANVVIMDLPGSPGPELAESLGPSAAFAPGDVTSEEAGRAAVATAAERFGGLHVLVNCAGIGSGDRIVGKEGPYPLDRFRRVIDVNLIGTFNMLRLAAWQMVQQDFDEDGRGVVVNTASVAGYEGQIGQIAYSASKAGIIGMTICAARDLASAQVRVCTIAPGLMDTPLLGGLREDIRASLAASVPHPRRLGQPAEYARLALAIVENPYLNGETIRLDGAIRMAPR